ncbi:hypothetical protein PRIPAC_72953 [Pristionchus pacificus]|nr:hypothetical protein PRIPAC_72953 [Pristionchus pacificus]
MLSNGEILTLAGTICNCLSYVSHMLVFTQTTLKAMQVTNRFTALFFPLKHDDPSLYQDAGGRLKYAGIERSAQELAKLISAADQVVFVIVTLPMNVMLLVKMRRLRKENLTQFQKERMYLYYVLVITVAHMIKGAHQYAYPNTITTFTPPITLILMSQKVRNGIQLFLCNRNSGANVVDSAYSHRVTPM